jgi:hypothetical protein
LSPDRVVIPRASGCVDCSYIIGIYGHVDSVFSVSAGGDQTALRLIDGRPERDYANVNEYEYYSFEVVTDHQDVVFILTPFSGDPDLFVSRTNPHPNATDYDWKKRSFGTDVIPIVYGSDPKGGPGVYYVSVFGFRNSSYTILAATNNDYPALLMPGIPQSGYVLQSQNDYYICFLPADMNSVLKIALTTISGDTDLYVNVGDNPAKPLLSNSMYRSTQISGDDLVVIRHEDPAVAANCLTHSTSGCEVLIDVEAYKESQYSITCSLAGDSVELISGKPVTSLVSRKAKDYYVLPVDALNTLRITVTPISGDPDVYISTTHKHPNDTSATWKSDRNNVEDIIIPRNDVARYCAIPCKFYITVYGYSLSSYSILATLGDDGTTQLLNGVPQAGACRRRSQGNTLYYKFSIGNIGSVDLNIQTNIQRGAVEIYVSNRVDTVTGELIRPTYDSASGKMTNFIWTSAGSINPGLLRIAHSDAGFCESCSYIIAVISLPYVSDSRFSIVASSAESLIVLQDGVSHDDRVYSTNVNLNYQRYSVPVVYPDSILTIAVTPYFGKTNVYIAGSSDTTGYAANDHPNSSNYTWTFSADQSNVFTISLAKFPTTACQPTDTLQCLYYIGISTTSAEASYSIMASINAGEAHPINLQNGLNQIGYVLNADYMNYYIEVDGIHSSVSVSVSPRFGSAQLYLTTNITSIPTIYNYEQFSKGESGLSYITLPLSGIATVLNIAVYGTADCEYSILVATDDAVISLQDGIPINSRLTKGFYRYYRFDVPNYPNYDGRGIYLEVTAFAGDPDLFVTTSTGSPSDMQLPSKDNYKWKSEKGGSDTLLIPKSSDPNFCLGCSYLIAVVAFSNVSVFYFLEPHSLN